MVDNTEWKNRIQDLVGQFQEEVKKTTQIGMKMLSASKANSCLNKHYEELGELVFEALKKNTLEWENTRAKELVKDIQSCLANLSEIEKEVHQIKKSHCQSCDSEEDV